MSTRAFASAADRGLGAARPAPAPERADGVPRHRRRLRRRAPAAHRARRQPGRAPGEDGPRRSARPDRPTSVHVLCGDIGGSFGLKIGAAREDIAVAAASRALERPVKWIEDRGEHLMASGHAREESMEAEARRVPADGDILGMKVDDDRRHRRLSRHGRDDQRADRAMLPGPYKVGALRLHVHRRPSPTRPRTSPTGGRGPPRCSRASG